MDSKNGRILDEASVRLWKLEDGTLVLKYLAARGERKALIAAPRRALPLTDPERWIVFSDNDGTEIGVLPAIDGLDESSQAVLREALRSEYSLERIVRVLEVEREPLSGQTRWRVEIESSQEDAPVEASNRDGSKLASAELAAPDSTAPQSTGPGESDAEPSTDASGDGEEKLSRRAKVASLLSLGRDKSTAEEAISTVEREFTIAGQEDVQTARYPHIFIVDTERRRYEILDCEALDTDSRKAAERFF
jgi:hypothetical protein